MIDQSLRIVISQFFIMIVVVGLFALSLYTNLIFVYPWPVIIGLGCIIVLLVLLGGRWSQVW